jgi:hypothetical protein
MWLFDRAAKREQMRKEHESFIAPLKNLLAELFADRGMLLGSTQYNEMIGVEKCKALSEIDDRIIAVKERIHSEATRWKQRLL